MTKKTGSVRSGKDTESVENEIRRCRLDKELSLDLSGKHLTEIPEEVRELTWLHDLALYNNSISRIPEWIGELSELRSLEIYYNPIESVPFSIAHLKKLTNLLIDGQHSRRTIAATSEAFEAIGALRSLRTLALANLGLSAIPIWVKQLKQLRVLYLHGNRLSKLPDWLLELRRLEVLQLNHNRLSALPESLRSLKSLKRLLIAYNPKLGIPEEIAESDDARKVLTYYFRTNEAGASLPLNEFKLILVGRGGVGKTTLVHRLIENEFRRFDRTPGINITKWPKNIDGQEIHAHIWDFGGQEIMHGTHRFFMTERALYLVLISGREGTEDHDAEYWLSMIRSFAGDVPIIVLLNKWDDYRFELNRELLRQKYGERISFIETDSSSGYGIPTLREQIFAQAYILPGLSAKWPSAWRQVKDDLPSQKKSWLTYDDFKMFCSDRGVQDPSEQEDLAESLHDLGLMLSYRKEDALRNFGVLNPEWVTDGIYKMLNSPLLREAGGRFTVKSFCDVLPAEDYPESLHPYLLALMRKFQLCHPLDNTGEQYLIPELLTKEEPKLDSEFSPEQCLGFIYSYDAVLPEGLLPRFIVETYVHQEPKYAWRTGVVLERANSRALVRGDVLGRKVTIRVAGIGNGRRELLGIIREYFERIHKSYEKLPVTEMVPIPGHPLAQVKYDLLLKYERSGRNTIAVDIGDDLMDVPVKELLDGVDIVQGTTQRSKTKALKSLGISYALPVFISYAHKDDTFMDQLRAALVPYERTGELEVWADPLIEPGQEWEGEIFRNLNSAQILILLLSNDFIRSSFCIEKELARAVERQAKGECEIIPVLIRACRFDKLEIGKTQAIIPGNRPIDEHEKKDPAWFEVTKQLDKVIARIKKSKS